MDVNGWTDFRTLVDTAAYANSKVVYVSSTDGNDGTGSAMNIDDSEIGSDPFAPTGSILPYATISAAYGQLRDGYPDILLLKRGDTWSETLGPSGGEWSKSGRSATEPMIVAAYGSEVNARPILKPQNYAIQTWTGGVVNYCLFSSIEIYAAHKDDASPDFIASNQPSSGIYVLSGGTSILFEDMRLRFCGIALQSYQNPIGSVVVRRCAVERNYALVGHAQGIFASKNTASFNSLLVEDCVFDHNGWHPTLMTATVFSRNMYLSQIENTTTRGNIDARGASGGIQQRRGGLCEFNLSLLNPIAISVGHPENDAGSVTSGTIRYNAILDGRFAGTIARGFGIGIGSGDQNITVTGVHVHDNIITSGANASSNVYGIHNNSNDARIENNIVYDWWEADDLQSFGAYGHSMEVGSLSTNSVVTGNTFYQPTAGFVVYAASGVPSGLVFTNNHYQTVNDAPNQVRYEGSHITLSAWLTITSESNTPPSHLLPTPADVKIAAYLTYIGETGNLDEFMTGATSNRRGAWDTDYTAPVVINWARSQFGLTELAYSYESALPSSTSGNRPLTRALTRGLTRSLSAG